MSMLSMMHRGERTSSASRPPSGIGRVLAKPRITVGIPTFNRAEMLRESIESVLSQPRSDLRLVVCDNASADDTADVVASFNDSRLAYVRSDVNVGMIGNLNRAIGLAETEFLVLLPDDDLLYPGYFDAVMDVFDRYPRAGLVHTAFDLIDHESALLEADRNLLGTSEPVVVESGHQFLKRSMRVSWPVCFSSAMYRTAAIVGSGGLNAEEEPFADLPMWMRLALDWDFAFLGEPLAAIRVHGESATAALGSFVGGQIDVPDRNDILLRRRTGFLATARSRLSRRRVRLYRRLAQLTYRDEEVRQIANSAGSGAPWTTTWRRLLHEVRRDPATLLLRRTWQLVLAQLGARWGRHTVLRLLRRPSY
jgi:glycosyltransferase involved in cell wall biosynthesis